MDRTKMKSVKTSVGELYDVFIDDNGYTFSFTHFLGITEKDGVLTYKYRNQDGVLIGEFDFKQTLHYTFGYEKEECIEKEEWLANKLFKVKPWKTY